MSVKWCSFDAKFDGQQQDMFELLSYLLFCREHNKPQGIFRYLNQTGIETEPIESDGRVIGFQAKYLTNSISKSKSIIKDGLRKAREKHSQLDVVQYYLPREFGQSSKKDRIKTQYQIEIESYAGELGLTIDWRVPSHFEAQLLSEENRYLLEYFFELKPRECRHEIFSHMNKHRIFTAARYDDTFFA